MPEQKFYEVVSTEIFHEKLKRADVLLEYFAPTLTSKETVSKFLGKSTGTITNMIKDERLKEGVHYYIKESGIIKFIPLAIIDYKSNPTLLPSKAKEPYQPSQEAKDFLS